METCVVGCKLPHGLNLDLVLKADADGKAVETQRILLKGKNSSHIIGGYGLTQGVPKEAFERWLAENQKRAFVRNGSVFMESNKERARKAADERRDERTGLEAIDPLKAVGVEPEGDDEKKARAKLRQQQAENPDRNRQIVE